MNHWTKPLQMSLSSQKVSLCVLNLSKPFQTIVFV